MLRLKYMLVLISLEPDCKDKVYRHKNMWEKVCWSSLEQQFKEEKDTQELQELEGSCRGKECSWSVSAGWGLDLHCPPWQLLVTCGHWALATWLVWIKTCCKWETHTGLWKLSMKTSVKYLLPILHQLHIEIIALLIYYIKYNILIFVLPFSFTF